MGNSNKTKLDQLVELFFYIPEVRPLPHGLKKYWNWNRQQHLEQSGARNENVNRKRKQKKNIHNSSVFPSAAVLLLLLFFFFLHARAHTHPHTANWDQCPWNRPNLHHFTVPTTFTSPKTKLSLFLWIVLLNCARTHKLKKITFSLFQRTVNFHKKDGGRFCVEIGQLFLRFLPGAAPMLTFSTYSLSRSIDWSLACSLVDTESDQFHARRRLEPVPVRSGWFWDAGRADGCPKFASRITTPPKAVRSRRVKNRRWRAEPQNWRFGWDGWWVSACCRGVVRSSITVLGTRRIGITLFKFDCTKFSSCMIMYLHTFE